jgi:two-component system, response regulator PdtaR
MLAVEVVAEAGFVPLEAADADEAAALLETRLGHFTAVQGHKHARKMDGLKLAHAVRDRWPPIKILVVSGQLLLQQFDPPSQSCFFENHTARRS